VQTLFRNPVHTKSPQPATYKLSDGNCGEQSCTDWSHDGKWLATSGSNQLILWPFQAKDGPMGKAPQIMAQTGHQVDVVACHPRQPITAVGYADGMVLIVRNDDGAEILAKRPGDAPVTALAWSQDGTLLAFGTESGEAGVLDLS